jgi:hypothetical protein
VQAILSIAIAVTLATSLVLLVIPSIPIAVWFSVLYYHYLHEIAIPSLYNLAMVTVGVIFVVNSLDSLMRLHTDNPDLTAQRFGQVFPWYVIGPAEIAGTQAN